MSILSLYYRWMGLLHEVFDSWFNQLQSINSKLSINIKYHCIDWCTSILLIFTHILNEFIIQQKSNFKEKKKLSLVIIRAHLNDVITCIISGFWKQAKKIGKENWKWNLFQTYVTFHCWTIFSEWNEWGMMMMMMMMMMMILLWGVK